MNVFYRGFIYFSSASPFVFEDHMIFCFKFVQDEVFFAYTTVLFFCYLSKSFWFFNKYGLDSAMLEEVYSVKPYLIEKLKFNMFNDVEMRNNKSR